MSCLYTPHRNTDQLRIGCAHPRPDLAVLAPQGEIDMLTASHLTASIAGHCREHTQLVLDMRLVDFLDVRGVHALHTGDRLARARHSTMLLVGADQSTARVINLCDDDRASALRGPRPDTTSATASQDVPDEALAPTSSTLARATPIGPHHRSTPGYRALLHRSRPLDAVTRS